MICQRTGWREQLSGGLVALTGKKSDKAFRNIREVSEDLDVPQHVLRFWESKFSEIRPLKRGGRRRYYRPEDVALLKVIRELLYVQGYKIRGVQRLLREGKVTTVDSVVTVAPAEELESEGLGPDAITAPSPSLLDPDDLNNHRDGQEPPVVAELEISALGRVQNRLMTARSRLYEALDRTKPLKSTA